MSEVLARLRENAAARESNLTERDALILEAREENVPVTHIADAVGLTRQQVHRILADKY